MPIQDFFSTYRLTQSVVQVTEATKSLTPVENVVHCDTTDNAIAVTMPPPGEAKFKFFSIMLVTDGGNDVTIDDGDQSYDWQGDVTLADAKDGVLYWCDGVKYWELVDNYT